MVKKEQPYAALGLRIKQARRAAGKQRGREYTQAELADRMDVSVSTISNYERGITNAEPALPEIEAALARPVGLMRDGSRHDGLLALAVEVVAQHLREGGDPEQGVQLLREVMAQPEDMSIPKVGEPRNRKRA